MTESNEKPKLKFNQDGLVAAIIQDARTGEVLMQAYMNRQAFDKTLETGLCHFYSRSRGKLWLKGEESGHTQKVKSVHLDCDSDAVLIKVEQKGGACHMGYRSCFFTELDPASRAARPVGERVFDPKKIYK